MIETYIWLIVLAILLVSIFSIRYWVGAKRRNSVPPEYDPLKYRREYPTYYTDWKGEIEVAKIEAAQVKASQTISTIAIPNIREILKKRRQEGHTSHVFILPERQLGLMGEDDIKQYMTCFSGNVKVFGSGSLIDNDGNQRDLMRERLIGVVIKDIG